MRISTKKLIVIALIAFLIVAIVCLLPWPTRVDVQMTGVEVTEDGTYKNDYVIQLKGWKLNYLFQDDTVKLDIQINDANGMQLHATNNAPIYPLSNKVDCSSWFVYMDDTNRMEVLSAYLDKDLNWLAISVCDRYFVAAADANADLQAYWEICAEYIQ